MAVQLESLLDMRIRFGVPMIGEYVNTGRGRRVTISPAVPGAQYRITAWALGGGTRSATPAVVYTTTGEASEFYRLFNTSIVHRCTQTLPKLRHEFPVCSCDFHYWQKGK